MCECKVSVIFVVTNLVLASVKCFNIDNINYASYSPPRHENAMFGFTVAIHKENNNGWLLVGAPEAQSVNQQTVQRGGAVYKCPIDRDDSCEEIPFDRQGNQRNNYTEIDNKNYQWFGATLSASGVENGPVVACAPRYSWYTNSLKRIDPVGTCYVSDGVFNNFNEYAPCRAGVHTWGYHRQGSCQAGFSAAINADGDRVFVGAPGSWYWQGQLYSIDAHARFQYTPGFFSTFGQGRVFQQSLETRPAVFSTKEGTEKDDDTYMGYSVVVGDFNNDGTQGIAAGMPRGGDLLGKVLLLTWNLTNYKNFTSDQLGSYFGYSLATVDIDGDRKTDLIVGAPLYTLPNNEDKYEVGRVYVIYQEGKYGIFSASYAIDGFKSKSRFGHSLASLGDINQDGYGDIAIGAPYDGPKERGAVYIYHGSERGVREKYSQVIYAEDINMNSPPNTFGFSVTGGMDLDGNDYPDMAVGAYDSNSAFFFRSRPVVRVEAFVKFRTANKQIDLKQKTCSLRDRTPAVCTTIDFCVKYSGKGIPQSISLDVQYILDTKKLKNPRMAFLDYENTNTINDTFHLVKDNKESCKTKQVYIKGDVYDKLTPLEAEVKYWMQEDRRVAYFEERNPRSQLKPIIDLNSPPSRKDSISVQKNCGLDNICIPNLTLDIKSNVNKYYLGSKDNLSFTVLVNNMGEDSFESTFHMKYPEGIYLKKIIDDKTTDQILCSSAENRTIICEIGNPLPAGKIAKFEVLLQPAYRQGMSSSYDFQMFVNSTNPEEDYDVENNFRNISIPIWVDSELELRGKSSPSDVFYNTTQFTSEFLHKEADIGPQVIHAYFLRNLGPVPIDEAEMYLLWPHATLEGEDFLYLLEQPHTLGNVRCEHAPVNYRNLLVDHQFRWDRIDIKESAPEFTKLTSGGVYVENSGGTIATVGGAVSHADESITSEVASSGDGSNVQQQRHNVTHVAMGNTSTTYSEYETKVVNGRPITTVTNTTTITDSNGNVLRNYTTKGYTNQHFIESSGTTRGNAGRSGTIVTTHSKYETIITNGVPVTTVVNTTTVSDALTGKILHQDTVTGGSMRHVSTGSGGYYQGHQASGSKYGQTTNQFNTDYNRFQTGNRYNQQGGIQDQYRGSTTFTQDSKSGLQHGGFRERPNIVYTHSGGKTYEQETRDQTIKTETYSSSSTIRPDFSISGQSNIFDASKGVDTSSITVGESVLGHGYIGQVDNRLPGGQGRQPYVHKHFQEEGGNQGGQSYVHTHFREDDSREKSQTGYIDEYGVYHSLQSGTVHQDRGRNPATYGQYDGSRDAHKDIQEHGLGAAALGHGFTVTAIGIGQGQNESRTVQTGRHKIGGFDQEVSVSGDYDTRSGVFTETGRENKIIPHQDESHILEERRRVDELRRLEERRQQEETRRKLQLEESRRLQIQEEERKRIYEEQIRLERKQEEERKTHKLEEERRRADEERRRTQLEETKRIKIEEDRRRVQLEEDRRRKQLEETTRLKLEEDRRRSQLEDARRRSQLDEDRRRVQLEEDERRRSQLAEERRRTQLEENRRRTQTEESSRFNSEDSRRTFTSSEDRRRVHFEEEDRRRLQEEERRRSQTEEGRRSSFITDEQRRYMQLEHERRLKQEEEQRRRVEEEESEEHRESSEYSGGNRQEWHRESHFSKSGTIPPTYIKSVGDNVPTDRPNYGNNRYTGRRKREAQKEYESTIQSLLECKATKCFRIKCIVGRLDPEKEVVVALRSRINAKTLKNITTSQPIMFSSMMLASISRLPYIGKTDPEKREIHKHEIFTTVPGPAPEIKADVVPLWIVLLSVMAGALILLLAIYTLYKLGFFKRNRPSSAPERQPLNRNGYHHDD